MTSKVMYELRRSGYTYQSIADMCQTSKQNVYVRVMRYERKAVKGIRKDFNINEIIFKGIYEHFKNNPNESICSFSCKVWGYSCKSLSKKVKALLTGKNQSYLNASQIKRICEVCGTSFEETFAER
jgi:hypothetical protein